VGCDGWCDGVVVFGMGCHEGYGGVVDFWVGCHERGICARNKGPETLTRLIFKSGIFSFVGLFLAG